MTRILTQESLTCEFKSDRKCLLDRELIEAVVCMANGDGGEIYLGVEDDGRVSGLQQADALRQSILKKAFCGQLVKQAKNEEPATALLERIRAARATSPAKGPQAKMGSNSLPNC